MKKLHEVYRSTAVAVILIVLFVELALLLELQKYGQSLPKRGYGLGQFFRLGQSRNEVYVQLGIILTEERGYTEFTASILRKYHETDERDINIYKKNATGHNHSRLLQWYGANSNVISLGTLFPLRNVLREFVDQEKYDILFLIDSNMIFLANWKMFIINHMKDNKSVEFLSLYHSAHMHSLTSDCENPTKDDLCEGPLHAKLGVALSKHLAEKILLQHFDLLERYNWDEILRREKLPSLYPRNSLLVNIRQTNQTDNHCGKIAVPYGFYSCEFPAWIRDGLEWYMDRCTDAHEKYIPSISIQQAIGQNRSWTRPAISYSLYGSNTRYTSGALENSKRVYSIYPEWKIWIYLDNTVPKMITDKLCKQNVKFINMTGTDVINKMSWRFLIAEEPVPMYAIRDIDSKLLSRGKAAVDEWIKSGRNFHVIRDHPNHAKYPINGGMWGGRVAIPNMRSMIKRYRGGNDYMTDMNFLGSVVWKIVKQSVWAHDSHSLHIFGEDHPFPTPWNPEEFVGNVNFS